MSTELDKKVIAGMTVYSADGEKLGKVVARGGTTFLVEKGFFFPRQLSVPYADLRSVRGNTIHLSQGRGALERHSAAEQAAAAAKATEAAKAREAARAAETARAAEAAKAAKAAEEAAAFEAAAAAKALQAAASAPRPSADAAAATMKRTTPAGVTEELRIPLAEEQLSARKHTVQAGEVDIRKEVVTEQRTITVPVSHEVVYVERVLMGKQAQPGEATFQGSTIAVPVYEEQVEVVKRPMVREEIRVTKQGVQEEAVATSAVRTEQAEVSVRGSVAVAEATAAELKQALKGQHPKKA